MRGPRIWAVRHGLKAKAGVRSLAALDAAKVTAAERGVPCQRLIREAIGRSP